MELSISNNFIELKEDTLTQINAGSVWGVVGGVATVVAGAATVVGGVAMLCIPEPTTATKFAGAGMIATGAAFVGGGVAQIGMNI
ncbi:hypothetical protein RBH29_01760 [Herbivorax sp. ANBcel31]|uniref:hypothetical protein n=1 Tax=Herbivorax sp. ANBcel31 TaxID=3069754 RepID=UPI0027B01BB1|nr:hypothetical protein [Herbivorax sp. ANBcel31]MDQ2085161.1 hypothetical protein [Herbivorax sp. ANBcel31]